MTREAGRRFLPPRLRLQTTNGVQYRAKIPGRSQTCARKEILLNGINSEGEKILRAQLKTGSQNLRLRGKVMERLFRARSKPKNEFRSNGHHERLKNERGWDCTFGSGSLDEMDTRFLIYE
jgi:hypothetical protein